MPSLPVKVQIREYNLPDFCNAIVNYAAQGYVMSDTNEGYPKHFIGVYECEMLVTFSEDEMKEIEEEKNKPSQGKAGRPAKKA